MSFDRTHVKIPRVNLTKDKYVPLEKNFGEIESICTFCEVADDCKTGICSHFIEQKKKILERRGIDKK